MWKLTRKDLARFQGKGGEEFAHFVDSLIRAETARSGLAQSEIATQLRSNIPDGGVDTEVKRLVPNDLSGWFNVPTCWQFKAKEARDIDDRKKVRKRNELQDEIHKPYAKELIGKGYGYRLCILGGLTAQKLNKWEALLLVE